MIRVRRNTAFSLTEILVVVAIVLILVSLVFVVGERIYARGLQTQCANRLEKIGQALVMYQNASGGLMPMAWDPYTGRFWYETLFVTHLRDREVLGCPVVDEPPPLGHLAGVDEPPPPRHYADPVLELLRWLSAEQIKEGGNRGRWPTIHAVKFKYPSLYPYYEAISGLALLAFLGYGCNDKEPSEFAETVRLAVDYLDRVQLKSGGPDDLGRFDADNHDRQVMWAQCICTLAMATAAGTLQDGSLRQKARQSAELGLRHLSAHHGRHVGDWECGGFYYYGAPPKYYNPPYASNPGEFRGYKIDNSLSAWGYQAMAVCEQAGIPLSQVDRRKFEEFAYQGTSPRGYSTYWWYPPYPEGRIPAAASSMERMVPCMLASRLMMGQSPGSSAVVQQADVMRDGPGSHPTSIEYLQQKGGRDFHTAYFMNVALYRMGGDYWEPWAAVYPQLILKHIISGQPNDDGEPTSFFSYDCCGTSSIAGGGNSGGDVYSTAIGAMILEIENKEHWLNPDWEPPTGKCSYGYNNRLGRGRRSLAATTIQVMDYESWSIDHDGMDEDDSLDSVATRHSDRANALMGDGSVRALYLEDIHEGMWTPEPGD
ncbi:MAG: H-X9-DG-CTERM domain-containing protein [Planctomycetota bacterium]